MDPADLQTHGLLALRNCCWTRSICTCSRHFDWYVNYLIVVLY